MRHLQKWIDIISAQQCAATFTILHLNSMVVPFHLLQIPSVYTLYIIPLGLGIMEEKQKWIQQYNIYEFCYDFTVHFSVYELHNYCKDLIHFITIYIWKWYLWYMKRETRFIVDYQLVYYSKGIFTSTCQSDALWRFAIHINWNVCLIYMSVIKW